MQQRILVVDDEPQIQRFLKPAFIAAGFDVETAGTATEAKRLAATRAPDLIVLDLGLPDGDGKTVIGAIRSFSSVPIIVLSARDQEIEKIAALDLGANDYVEKPFGIGELLARVRVALRQGITRDAQPREQVFGAISLDVERHQVWRDGEIVHLTPKEFELLALLAHNAGMVVPHHLALNQVWGPAHREDTQYLRVVVGQLRAKLEADPKVPRHILTEPGIGYRLTT